MSCKGLHCGGCKDGGGGVLLAIAAIVIIGAIIAKPVEHAVGELLHILLIAAAVLGGTAVIAAGTWLAVITRRDRPAEVEHDGITWSRDRSVVQVDREHQAAVAEAPAAAPELHQHLHIHVATAREASAILAAQPQPWQQPAADPDYTGVIPRTFQPAALRGVQSRRAIEEDTSWSR